MAQPILTTLTPQERNNMALKKAPVTSLFNGQGYIIVFDEVEDYNTATLDDILKNGADVGQVFEGTTSWTGEEPSFEEKLDEQGDVIIGTAKKGTYGFEFLMADFSVEKFQTYMHARTVAFTGAAGNAISSNGGTAVAVGSEIPVITRPIGIVNEECDKVMLLPKARIVTGPSMEDKAFGLKSVVLGLDCDTAALGTFMLIDKIKVNVG